jgi:hypothetical protein
MAEAQPFTVALEAEKDTTLDTGPATTLDRFAKPRYAQDILKILIEAAQETVQG